MTSVTVLPTTALTASRCPECGEIAVPAVHRCPACRVGAPCEPFELA